MKLFCIPYSGATCNIYNKWIKYLSDEIEIYPIELPGRGRKFKENFCANLSELTDSVYESMKNYIDDKPYALFGHSLGAWIIFELYFKFISNNYSPPDHIFFSGNRAPHLKSKKMIHQLSFDNFVKEIMDLGGTDTELLNNKDSLKMYIPILRADYKVAETYETNKKGEKIFSEITVLFGKDDDITCEEILAWKIYAGKKCIFKEFKGGHFFINTQSHDVINLINKTISHII